MRLLKENTSREPLLQDLRGKLSLGRQAPCPEKFQYPAETVL
jgi:hypothetical protein